MYELIDFGEGRRLERFGPYLLDRPAAGTEGIARSPESPAVWSQATARFEPTSGDSFPQRGRWVPDGALPESWIVEFGALRFEVKPTEFGHLGVFPEQAENWIWIDEQIRNWPSRNSLSRNSLSDGGDLLRRPKVLNLFAYTGGSTMAAAAAGAEVVHVDSARGTVAWARRNAEHSGLTDAPIRWIVEDARRFVRRELARGNRYDAVILDPPSYGHGPKGQNWKLERDLPTLLQESIALFRDWPPCVLLSCHTPGITPSIAGQMLADALKTLTKPPGTVPIFAESSEQNWGLSPSPPRFSEVSVESSGQSGRIATGELSLQASSSRILPCGVAARIGARGDGRGTRVEGRGARDEE